MINVKSIMVTLIVATTLMMSACVEGDDVRILKLSHNHNLAHPIHLGLLHMNEKLQEVSGGRMKIQIYPGEQLGAEEQCVEMLQIGSLAMAKVSAATLSNIVDEFKLFGLPYVFESREQLFDILDGEIGSELLLSTERCLIRGLAYFDAGARSFYTTSKPILTPDDLKGLRIRVMPNAMAVNMMIAFGGSATPIAFGELYTALQSGVVDGAENNPPSFQLGRDYEVAKFYSINEHAMIPDVLIISNVIWNSLSAQEREWLQEAIDSAERYQRKVWQESEQKSMEIVKAAGVKVFYPDKQPFIDMVKDQAEKYRDNKALYQMVQRIEEYKRQYNKEL